MKIESLDQAVDVSWNDEVTELAAPNATTIYARGCTGLTEAWERDRLIPLLTATGKSVSDVLATGCWDCHSWENCPMHVVFGVNSTEQIPKQWRSDAAIFIGLFDANILAKPVVA